MAFLSRQVLMLSPFTPTAVVESSELPRLGDGSLLKDILVEKLMTRAVETAKVIHLSQL